MIYFKEYAVLNLNYVGLSDGEEYMLDYPIAGSCELIYCSETDELVGILKYSAEQTSITIESLEIFTPYRRKGYAKHTITMIKNLYPNHTILGQTPPYKDIKKFFIEQGATFNSCSKCLYFKLCGGVEYLGIHCDSPNDYAFIIPTKTPTQKHEICVTKGIHPNIPVIVVELGISDTTEDESEDMIRVANNINKQFSNNLENAYSTCEASAPIKELKVGKHLPYYMDNNANDFINDLKALNLKGFIQIAGIHRELCVAHVARLIKENIPALEPIILTNDNYSISAKVSVEHGDTLERTLGEKGYSIRVI